MKDEERDALFARARTEASPSDDDRRRVRAAIHRKLGVAAGASVGVTAAKAAASVIPAAATGTPAAVAAAFPIAALVKVAAVVAAVGVIGYSAMPPRRVSSERANAATPTVLAADAVHASPAFPESARVSPPRPVAAEPNETTDTIAAAAAPPVDHRVRAARDTVTSSARAGDPSTASKATLGATPVDTAAALPAPAPSAGMGPEVELVKEMQVALRDGDNARVFALVREHEQRFPSSVLAPEREGAKVLASCAEAAPIDAEKMGEEFLARHPLSPLAARVRATCGPSAERR